MRTKRAIKDHQQIHSMARANFFIQSEKVTYDLAAKHFQDKEKSFEVIDLPQQIMEQDYCAFTKASQAIKERCPAIFPNFKRNIINVLSIIYFDRDSCNLQVDFNERFYDAKGTQRHWVPIMFEELKKRPNPREFMQQQMDHGNLKFVQKTDSQLDETKDINGMARLLFPIFLGCHFIPNSYVILLAVLMNTTENI